ncbi:MAG TPA: AAA family ATPase, partial [Acidimicrobiales bacterium]|nr:AAA family ATPase [Acidimicrobiales bacterium]
MRIDGWHIDGFGVFADAAARDLPAGLTVVSGPNEAGKSTLLAFLRGVLFGFPDGRHRARQHPPVRGGRHGGRVMLRDDDGGRWTIGRHIEANGKRTLTVRRPDGAFGTAADIAVLLGGADATLFANVFAFSLTELDGFDVIGSDEVRDRVFSAGVVGAGRSARAALAELDGRRSRRVRPRGRCEVRDAFDAFQEASVDLDRARAEARVVAARRREVDELDASAQAARGRVEQARAELLRAEALVAAWPAWVRRLELDERQAATAPSPPGIDERTEAAWVRARAELDAAAAAADEARLALDAADDQLRAVEVDDRLPAVADEARAVFADLSVERGRRSRLAELPGTIAERDASVARLLDRLGAGWDRERLAAPDLTVPPADEVRAIAGAVAGAADAAARADAERAAAEAVGFADSGALYAAAADGWRRNLDALARRETSKRGRDCIAAALAFVRHG